MSALKRAYSFVQSLGFDPRMTIASIAGLPAYLRDRRAFTRQMSGKRDFAFLINPCLSDRFSAAGVRGWQYFRQDLFVAQRIFAKNPDRHVDVGSRIDGFVAHVASFREIEVMDIRPMATSISRVTFRQVDLMVEIPDYLVECCDSLSCLHALEHFGLGRYGDPVMYDGHMVGLKNLHATLKKGGTLYLSVPIGPQRIEFNAHRVFDVRYLLTLFEGRFSVDKFSVVDDRYALVEDAPYDISCNFGCGIFELVKL